MLELLLTLICGAAFWGLTSDSREKAKEEAAREKRRLNTPCTFETGIPKSEFERIVYKAERKFKRLTVNSIDGAIIYAEVESQSGLSTWYFKVDFNDFGKVTGAYWWSSDNNQSDIPSHFSDYVQAEINKYYSLHNDCSYQEEKDDKKYAESYGETIGFDKMILQEISSALLNRYEFVTSEGHRYRYIKLNLRESVAKIYDESKCTSVVKRKWGPFRKYYCKLYYAGNTFLLVKGKNKNSYYIYERKITINSNMLGSKYSVLYDGNEIMNIERKLLSTTGKYTIWFYSNTELEFQLLLITALLVLKNA